MAKIGPVPDADRGRALDLLAGAADRGARRAALANLLNARGPDRCRLWWARTLRGPVAAAMTAVSPGRTAMIYHTPADECDRAVLGELLDRLSRTTLAAKVTFVQGLLPPTAADDAAALLDARYVLLAHLIYLRRALADLPAPSPGPLVWETFRAGSERRLGEVIAETYVGSRDCPELLGLRPMADVVAAHKSTGVFRPRWWWLPTLGGECVGCLLLNELSARPAGDVVYLGVRPPWRRRGLGRAMIRHAMHALADEGLTELHLAVDASNVAAVRLYEAEGFGEVDRKDVYIRTPDAPDGP